MLANIKNSGELYCLQGRRQALFIINIYNHQSQLIHDIFLPILLLCTFRVREKCVHHLKCTGFID